MIQQWKETRDALSHEQNPEPEPIEAILATWPPMVSAQALIDNPPDLPEEIITGLLWRGTRLQIGGGSKSMKTWALLDLAFCISIGRSWWAFSINQQPVLLIDLELPKAFLSRRLKAIARAYQADAWPLLQTWSLRGVDLSSSRNFEIALKGIEQNGGFVVAIIDPVYKLMGSLNENDPRDVNHIIRLLEDFNQRTHAAIIYTRHFSKGNQSAKEALDRASGHGTWERDADTVLTMTRHQKPNCFTIDIVPRLGPPVDSFVVEWKAPLFIRDEAADPTELKQPTSPGRKPKQLDDSLLWPLLYSDNAGGLCYSDWWHSIEAKAVCSQRTFDNRLKRYRAEQVIFQSSLDGKYQLTANFIKHNFGDNIYRNNFSPQ